MKKRILFFLSIGIVSADTIPTIFIEDSNNTPTNISSQSLNQKTINSMIQGNGDIGSVLKLNPSVKVENKTSSTDKLSDITASKIEINGAKFYQNSFLLDGVSNDSLLDPVNNNKHSISDVPGNENELFIDLDLIESIKVFDSGISAKYGNFNGGVIDVITKRADFQTRSKIKYKSTKSSFVNFYYKDVESEKDALSIQDIKKPNFKKDFFSIFHTRAINDKSTILSTYSYKKSITPKKHFSAYKNTQALSHNFLLKYSYYFEDDSILDLTGTYSNYENKLFKRNVKSSDYSNIGGGYNLKANYEKDYSSIFLTSALSYSYGKNSRENSEKDYKSWIKTNTKSWGLYKKSGPMYSNEGGYGNIDKSSNTLNFNTHIKSKKISQFNLEHLLSSGFDFKYSKSKYLRKENTYIYSNAKLNADIICNGSKSGCINNEQYFKDRKIYKKENVSADILSLGTYVQDELNYKNIKFTPGFRVDYNDYLKNVDFSHRINANIDLFSNKKTNLFFGINRYYSKSFLAFKLREARSPFQSEYRSTYKNELNSSDVPENVINPSVWNTSAQKGDQIYLYNNLETPYTDEKVIGLKQNILKNTFLIKYIQREGKKQFREEKGEYKSFLRPDGYLAYYKPISVKNTGKSSYEALNISIFNYKNIKFLSSNFRYNLSTCINLKNTSNFNTYNYETEKTVNKVFYKNKIIDSNDLPKFKNAKKVFLNLVFDDITYKIFSYRSKISISNLITYTDKYSKLIAKDESTTILNQLPNGNKEYIEAKLYEEKLYKSYTRLDTKINFNFKRNKKESLDLNLEIVNVFDQKTQEDLDKQYYSLGRQFWFEVSYKF